MTDIDLKCSNCLYGIVGSCPADYSYHNAACLTFSTNIKEVKVSEIYDCIMKQYDKEIKQAALRKRQREQKVKEIFEKDVNNG